MLMRWSAPSRSLALVVDCWRRPGGLPTLLIGVWPTFIFKTTKLQARLRCVSYTIVVVRH